MGRRGVAVDVIEARMDVLAWDISRFLAPEERDKEPEGMEQSLS